MSGLQSSELLSTDAANIALPWLKRCENVLADTFRGLHHIDRDRIKTIHDDCIEYNHYGELATYDYDELTRFVLSCHRWCVRGTISGSGPRYTRIRLYPRDGRCGQTMWQSHPAILDAIKKFDGS